MNFKTISTYQQRFYSTLSNSLMITGCLIIFYFLFQTASTLDSLIKHYIGITKVDSYEKNRLRENVVINVALLCIISYIISVFS